MIGRVYCGCMSSVVDLKNKGNDEFKKGEFKAARRVYADALDLILSTKRGAADAEVSYFTSEKI